MFTLPTIKKKVDKCFIKKSLGQNERTQKREMNEKKCIIITHLRLF